MATATVHGHSVSYDDSHSRLRHAISYLENTLSSSEAEVFFKDARDGSSGKFEDDNYVKLRLEVSGSGYSLSLRE